MEPRHIIAFFSRVSAHAGCERKKTGTNTRHGIIFFFALWIYEWNLRWETPKTLGKPSDRAYSKKATEQDRKDTTYFLQNEMVWDTLWSFINRCSRNIRHTLIHSSKKHHWDAVCWFHWGMNSFFQWISAEKWERVKKDCSMSSRIAMQYKR